MSGRKPKTSDEDKALFRKAVRDVRTLKQDKIPPYRRPLAPRPHMRIEDERQVIDNLLSDDWEPAELETGEELLFARPGLQHNVLRRLRRGQFTVGAELDLHGMSAREARQALSEFLLFTPHRCIRIIHGKGRGSFQKQPVLKGKVNNWLRQRDEVLAFCSARPVDGGTGALYVLLKRRH